MIQQKIYQDIFNSNLIKKQNQDFTLFDHLFACCPFHIGIDWVIIQIFQNRYKNMRYIQLWNMKGDLKFISQFVGSIGSQPNKTRLYGLCEMYMKYKKQYDTNNIFVSSNSSQSYKNRKH